MFRIFKFKQKLQLLLPLTSRDNTLLTRFQQEKLLIHVETRLLRRMSRLPVAPSAVRQCHPVHLPERAKQSSCATGMPRASEVRASSAPWPTYVLSRRAALPPASFMLFVFLCTLPYSAGPHPRWPGRQHPCHLRRQRLQQRPGGAPR